MQLTREHLLHLFDYDKDRNVLIWKNPLRRNTKHIIGQVAGRAIKGVWYVRVAKKQYRLEKLIALIETGVWHKNSVEARRDVSNKSGNLVGAFRSGKKYIAKISVHAKDVHLGTFKTSREAHEAYLKALEQR